MTSISSRIPTPTPTTPTAVNQDHNSESNLFATGMGLRNESRSILHWPTRKFFGWVTGNSNSIHKLESGPVIDIKTDIPLSFNELKQIGEHLGLSEENDLTGEIRALFIKCNEILKLSHYGKCSSEKPFFSKNYRLLKQEEWQASLEIDVRKMPQLSKAAKKIHINIAISKESIPGKKSILLYFLGSKTKSFTDNHQLVVTAMNAVGPGPVYKEIPRLIEIFKQILEKDYQLDLVSGHSLGAGVAQCFAMAIDNPNLIMIDPQLLTDRQADLVCKEINKAALEQADRVNKAALFNKPHGIAITVDYAKKPRGGLMTRMKDWKFQHPGVLQLKMPLLNTDGNGYIKKKNESVAHLVTEEPKAGNFGYHGAKPDMLLFNYAIDRFIDIKLVEQSDLTDSAQYKTIKKTPALHELG